MSLHVDDDENSFRLSPWINWFVILTLGPAFAFFLAGLCGFPASQETLQVILLIEIALMAAAVVLLVMVQAIGPWTDRERESKAWLRLLTPPPGSLLEELAHQPAEWDRRMDTYLRSQWRDFATGRTRPDPASAAPPTPTVAVKTAGRVLAATVNPSPVMNGPGRPVPLVDPNRHQRRPPPGQPHPRG